jgi:hypothetical protein
MPWQNVIQGSPPFPSLPLQFIAHHNHSHVSYYTQLTQSRVWAHHWIHHCFFFLVYQGPWPQGFCLHACGPAASSKGLLCARNLHCRNTNATSCNPGHTGLSGRQDVLFVLWKWIDPTICVLCSHRDCTLYAIITASFTVGGTSTVYRWVSTVIRNPKYTLSDEVHNLLLLINFNRNTKDSANKLNKSIKVNNSQNHVIVKMWKDGRN